MLPGPPLGQATALTSAPQVLSWDKKGSWSQERLVPYQDEVRQLAAGIDGASGLSVQLDARFAAKDLHVGRDLDNLLDPVAVAIGPERLVAVWGTKGEGSTSSLTIGRPRPLDPSTLGDWYHAKAETASFTDWHAVVATQLRGRVPLAGTGPVELIVALTIGPPRSWRNMWKPALDVLGGILARNPGHSWAPKDERIVRLGITREVDAQLGNGVRVAYWWRHAAPDLAPIVGASRRVVGVDGFPGGWVAVTLTDGRYTLTTARKSLAEVLADEPAATVFGVDIPIGLPEAGGRLADMEARKPLGPRASSVFPTPPRAALALDDYEAANDLARQLTASGISKQSWALRERIREANELAEVNPRMVEVHPELSFRHMAGVPLAAAKTSWNGVGLRRSLLARYGIDLPDDLGPVAATAPPADVLDAAAAAWSADRILRGEAVPYPNPPQLDGERAVAIWA